ncbi:MAG: hypothetical protein DHS20C16_21750 [Phycisphaerae bacterium]|nr:MAG: hypothetical protein DHS20C16_21750 [Phycisphaerae bacterium]
MSPKQTVHSPDIVQLRNEGFNIQLVPGFLLVHEVPYVDVNKTVKRGTLGMKLTMAGDRITKPDDHVAYFAGDYPCNADGTPIEGLRNSGAPPDIASGVNARHTFSAKPKTPFESYYAKARNYCAILSGPATVIDPSASPRTFSPPVPDARGSSVFEYEDTASTRAGIEALSAKLGLEKVAIVGIGGTGSYVLDLLAKTPVREIHIFDGDDLLTHNAFRASGAPSLEQLRKKPKKADYFAAIYSRMHRGVVAHAENIEIQNVDMLRSMDFVFICVDNGLPKRMLIDSLHEFQGSFIDVGMGIYEAEGGLGGIIRVTLSSSEKRDHVKSRISTAEGDDDNFYSRNIQVADLNALNAALAVMRWKQHLGFYMDFANEYHFTYGIEVNLLTKGERVA